MDDEDSVRPLPSTGNPLHPFSQDSTLAFAVPYDKAPGFLANIEEIAPQGRRGGDDDGSGASPDAFATSRWVMKAAQKDTSSSKRPVGVLARNAWIGFVDLIKVCVLKHG